MNVESFNVDYELVLVANYWDGTKDETPEVARSLARGNPHIKTVTMPKKGRMGWDMISGLNAAMGKYIAVIDGDGKIVPKILSGSMRK